ncbi:MAG: NADH-quinone oxidoreductase subunit I [Bacteroidia bacterium]|nr:NADH-quinone oxidoreductase subunit I [Bacteroidia bacterium]
MGKHGIITGDKKEREMTLGGKLYLPEVFKGMAYTLKQMFRKPVTLEYPEVKVELGPEFRGRPVLVAEEGKERCVACGLCARACPPFAISMQAAEMPDDQKERYPSVFEIDMLRCIYCGLCEEVCPEEAIVMSQEYDYNFRERSEAIMGKDKLVVDKEAVKSRLEFLEKRRNPNFGTVFNFDPRNNTHTLRNRDEVAGS